MDEISQLIVFMLCCPKELAFLHSGAICGMFDALSCFGVARIS
jgi:hypothetical protein